MQLICWLKGFVEWLRYGIYAPHVYTAEYQRAVIIADAKSFRTSESLEHTSNESVYSNACLIKYKCKYCGHESRAWHKDYDYFMSLPGNGRAV